MQKVQVQGRVGTKHRLGTECKHRLGTECREYKYRGEWEQNTGWELSAESTSRGENGMETGDGNWESTSRGESAKHRLGTECRNYKYK